MTEPIARQIVSLAEQGMSPKAIAHAAGVENVTYVYQVLQRAGFVLERRFVRAKTRKDQKCPTID